MLDILDRFLTAHGAQPTRQDAEIFARANGVPFPRQHQPWVELMNAWKAERSARGEWTPPRPPPTNERSEYGEPVGAARQGEQRRRKRWSDEELVHAVMRFLRTPDGQRDSTVAAYQAYAQDDPDLPGQASFMRRGGYAKYLAQALRRLRVGRR
jgi:hypothetical protein